MDRIDLQQFCSKSDVGRRYSISRPWRVGKWCYATNGHICVRVAAIDTDEEQPTAPDAARILELHPSPTYAPLRVKLPPIETVDCDACYKRGFYWENEDEDGEPDRKNPGAKIVCEDCAGHGCVEKQTSISTSGVLFAAKYILRKLRRALPDAANFRQIRYRRNRMRIIHPCPFRFTGGIGALMPMTGEGAAHLGDLKQFEVN